MSFDRCIEQLERGLVERALRLIEQPDRPGCDEEAGEGKPPLLPRRKESGGEIGQRGKAERGEGGCDSLAAIAEELGPELEILGDPEARLQDRKSTRLNSSHLGISYAV